MISGVSAMRLPQVIPQAKALEMMLLARNITAEEAMRIGLVNAVVDDVQAERRRGRRRSRPIRRSRCRRPSGLPCSRSG